LKLKKFNEFLLTNQYDQTQKIKIYIEAKYKKAKNHNTLNSELQAWIEWVNAKYDPLINKEDVYLRDIKKYEFEF